MRKNEIVIGSRKSPLALFQANVIRASIETRFPGTRATLLPMTTTGDRDLATPLATFGDKGLFTRELEDALVAERIDLAVHSLKDLPTDLPEGLALGGFSARDDVRDCLVSREGLSFEDLPRGARVGTSSARRRSQVLQWRPDLAVCDLRGNIATRLSKLAEGKMDAIVLAAAGLNRLGLASRITQFFEPTVFLPAPGQGIIVAQYTTSRSDMKALLDAIGDPASACAATAERAFLHALHGGCRAPVGALATLAAGLVTLRSWVGSPDGQTVLRHEETGRREAPAELGARLAEEMLKRGAGELIERARS